MPLLNAFIDSIVCVGFNSERGIIIDRESSDDNVIPLLSYLKPYVLGILTADQAVYPESNGTYTIDSSYPFIQHSRSSSGYAANSKFQKKQVIPNTFDTLPLFCSPDGVKISLIEESRIHHIVFTQEEGKRSYAVVLAFSQKFILKNYDPNKDGPYQIESMARNATKPSQSKKMPSAYRHNVNANPIGNMQSYSSPNATRRRLNSTSSTTETSGTSVHSLDSPELSSSPNRKRAGSNVSVLSRNLGRSSSSLAFDPAEPFYLPHFLVLISKHPYWTAMHEVISIINNEIRQKQIEPHSDIYKMLIQKYAFFACNTPIPPIAWERFSLSFDLINDQSIVTLDPPTHTNRSVLDLDLSILLLTLTSGKLIEVLAALLTQQAIIFFSTDYSKLMTTLEGLLYLLYPFKWIHTYIPVLPHSLRDYCFAGPPGSYIMGVNARYQSDIEDLNSCLTCNLDDEENIRIPPGTEFHRIPSTKLRRFISPITKFVEKIKIERSIEVIQTPIRLRADEESKHKRRNLIKTNNKIIEIFLDLMVDLCDDTLKAIYWTVDHQPSSSANHLQRPISKNSVQNQTKFSKETYLLSKTEGLEREFYRMFINTSAFEIFIEEERASTTTPTEFRKICQLRSQLNRDQSFRFTASTEKILSLPNWPTDVSTHYLDCCIALFTNELESARKDHSSPVISIYAYLRGCALIGRGDLLDGLRDLYLIENSNLFPKEYIQTTIIPLLDDASLLDRFRQESFYIQASEWKKIPERRRSSTASSGDIPPFPSTIIQGDVSSERFRDYVHQSSITYDTETAGILFKALLHWANMASKPPPTVKPHRRWSLGAIQVLRGNTYKEPANTIQKGSQSYDRTPINSLLPAKLFELFLRTWQRTNAEKARMNHCLPKDRQKQESILMISSTDITSKNRGRGKLILTQHGLHLLPNTHSSSILITDLLKIVVMDLYQQKTVFSTSKPAIRIYASHSSTSTNSSTTPQADGEPLDVLLFRDTIEQNFWHNIITELWAGVTIAYEECDASVSQKVSRHIALIDTLVNIDYNGSINDNKGNNQIALDLALNDFSVFTGMQKSGAFKRITYETRQALHDRLSPSFNENERYAVRCLVYTESSRNNYSLLWCAYGNKLKMFNTRTWICDPNELLFPSIINCMCLDASNKLWIGCIDGQLFIVDIIQRICGTQLASMEGKGGCQTMAFDTIRNQMLIANRSGLMMIWNTINRERLNDINLDEMYNNASSMQQRIYKTEMLLNLRSPTNESSMTVSSSIKPDKQSPAIPNELKTIQAYEDLLFACYRDDYILIFQANNFNTYNYDQMVSVRYNDTIPINSFLVYNQQLWISACYIIYIYDISTTNKKKSYKLIMKSHLDDDHLLTMLGVCGYIWAGSSRGNVYIFRTDNYERLKTFNGHKDAVCCLCPMLDRYVISGSQQFDTSIIIWENINKISFGTNTRL